MSYCDCLCTKAMQARINSNAGLLIMTPKGRLSITRKLSSPPMPSKDILKPSTERFMPAASPRAAVIFLAEP